MSRSRVAPGTRAFRLPVGGADKALLLFSGVVSVVFGIVMFAEPGTGASDAATGTHRGRGWRSLRSR